MAVDCIVTEVEFAAYEPFGKRRIGVIQHLPEWLMPIDEPGLLRPEGLAIIGVYFIVTAILGLILFERKEFN